MTYAEKLFLDAKSYDNHKAKARTLKMAYNAAIREKNDSLANEIDRYASLCGIDLSKVSGYDY